MKKCATPDCGWKELTEFHHDRTRHDRKNQYCKACVARRREERYKEQPKIFNKRNYACRRKVKAEAMSRYGGRCQCCGESRLDFLTLDHVNQNGAEHRRQIGGKMGTTNSATGYVFYLWLKKNNWPSDLGLQVLCFNCNCAKGSNGKCPHQLEREASLIDGLGI